MNWLWLERFGNARVSKQKQLWWWPDNSSFSDALAQMCQNVFRYPGVSMNGRSAPGLGCSTTVIWKVLVTFPIGIYIFFNSKAHIPRFQMVEAEEDVWAHISEKLRVRSIWIGSQVRGKVWLETKMRPPPFFSFSVTWSCLLHTGSFLWRFPLRVLIGYSSPLQAYILPYRYLSERESIFHRSSHQSLMETYWVT